MVKPVVIYELFKKFSFLLFYRNVRNPLPESNFNEQIARTLKKQPDLFWYFNNGITAISMIIPEIGNEAREIEITGLQVINGAQTVYSVYRTYEDASPAEREIMDRDALIMLRIVDSSNETINREITRYTNSQNPMIDRDFQANDDHQVRLQNSSFDNVYWYEKRRGEFRQVPPGIYIIENLTLAAAYLAFFIEDVHGAVLKNDFIFISRDIDPKGMYETVFTERIKPPGLHPPYCYHGIQSQVPYIFRTYAKKFSDNNFGIELGKFLAAKREEKTKQREEKNGIYIPRKTSSLPTSNRPENFERFVKRHKPKEVLEGEIIHKGNITVHHV